MKKIFPQIQTSARFVVAWAFCLFLTPMSAAAQFKMPKNTFGLSPDAGLDLILIRMITLFTQLLGFLAILMIVVGGVMYMTSAGDADRAERAKKWVQFSIVGFIIALLAYTSVVAIGNALGAG